MLGNLGCVFSEYFAKFSINKAHSLFSAEFRALWTEFCIEVDLDDLHEKNLGQASYVTPL